jgi:LPXTG-motif cell wall-anchored protein
MISVSFKRTILRNLLGAGLIWTAFALEMNAQEQTRTEVSNGPATQEVEVQRGVVIYVSGNDVVIKGEDGKIRDFPNVPDSARVTVDGQQLSVHDIQAGMTIERTTITTTTPRLITTIKTVSGTVWHVDPPTSVILTLENGKNQQFHIPDGTKFMIDGQPTDVFSLREGMKVSATAVTEIPETVITTQVNRTGELPPPVETVNPHVALLVILVPYDASADTAAADSSQPATEAAAAAPAEPTPAQLPKTGSSLSLLGLLGGLFCSLAIGLKARRAFNS